jgi:hypothetical protein
MHNCGEANFHKNKGKVWICQTDSYLDRGNQEVVFLDGFSGCFSVRFLRKQKKSAYQIWTEAKEQKLNREEFKDKLKTEGVISTESKNNSVQQSLPPNILYLVFSKQANEDFHKWFYNYYNKDKISVGAFNHEELFNNFQNIIKNAYLTDWFREVHNLHSYVERYDNGEFDYFITGDLFKEVTDFNDGAFKTFLEAQNKSIVQMHSVIYKNN